VVNLAVLACVLRPTTIKRHQLFKKKCIIGENPDYVIFKTKIVIFA